MKIQKREIKPVLVFQAKGKLFTDSLTIAKVFEKEHFDVLKAIRNLVCSSDFNARNFALVDYKDAKGEKRPKYEITKDGCMFLIMGFTGEKAAIWKERFIDEFNRMEQELLRRLNVDRLKAMQHCTTAFVLSNQNHAYQRNNSNLINSRNVFSEDDVVMGRKNAQNYNYRNCLSITDRTPRNWRDQGQELGLPMYVRKSAKEVARWVQPEMASARSIADELVEEGIAESIAFEIGRAMIVPSKMIIDSGFVGKRYLN